MMTMQPYEHNQQGYLNQQMQLAHPNLTKARISGGTGKKVKKVGNGTYGGGAMGAGNPMANSSNLSMVLVMNNHL